MKIRKDDTVLIISGKDKGAKGKVIRSYPKHNKVLVEGINRIKKHTSHSYKENGASSGGILIQESKIHVSCVMLVDSNGKPTRKHYKAAAKDNISRACISKINGKDA